jgi:hypothetical protein
VRFQVALLFKKTMDVWIIDRIERVENGPIHEKFVTHEHLIKEQVCMSSASRLLR